jgi:hypothetical protein
VKAAKAGHVNIPEAARLAFCMSEEVVRLILDGKLARKWRLSFRGRTLLGVGYFTHAQRMTPHSTTVGKVGPLA